MGFRSDGTSDYRVFASSANWNTATTSHFAWARVPTGASVAQFDRFWEAGGVASNAGVSIEVSDVAATQVEADVWNAAGGLAHQVGDAFTWTADTWFCYCLTSNTTGPSSKFYVNGTLSGAENVTDTRVTGAVTATITGQNGTPASAGPQADIAEQAVFDAILTQADVTMLSIGVSPVFFQAGGHLKLYYRGNPWLGAATTQEKNEMDATVPTVANGSSTDHPKLLYPSGVQVYTAGGNPEGARAMIIGGGLIGMGCVG